MKPVIRAGRCAVPVGARRRDTLQIGFAMSTYGVTSQFSTNIRIIEENVEFCKKTLYNLKHNKNTTILTLEKVCRILECRIEEIVEFTE